MLGIGQSGKSWKTTVWGIITAICGMATIAGSFFVPGVALVAIPIGAGMIGAGGGLIMAKDADVHSTMKEVSKATEVAVAVKEVAKLEEKIEQVKP